MSDGGSFAGTLIGVRHESSGAYLLVRKVDGGTLPGGGVIDTVYATVISSAAVAPSSATYRATGTGTGVLLDLTIAYAVLASLSRLGSLD